MDSISALSSLNTGFPTSGSTAPTDAAKNTVPINGTSQVDFSTALAEAGKDFVNTLQTAEATSIAGMKGQASTYQVASTMMEAEQTIKMTIAVRDKVVSAYQEITRMQI